MIECDGVIRDLGAASGMHVQSLGARRVPGGPCCQRATLLIPQMQGCHTGLRRGIYVALTVWCASKSLPVKLSTQMWHSEGSVVGLDMCCNRQCQH